MSLQVVKAGIADSIRDGGRNGYQHLGINVTGAMDVFAMQVANILVGNNRNEAVLELYFPASVFRFTASAIISLAGADFLPHINEEPVNILQPITVQKGDILNFKKINNGARCYLAVKGGIEADDWLGSKTTNTKAAAGGYEGRYLKKKDEINFSATVINEEKRFRALSWRAVLPSFENKNEIGFIPGQEWNWLNEEAKQVFLNTAFTIHAHSDSMGYRVENKKISAGPFEELVSTGVGYGTVQLLPDGSFIILMADHQTTGGYPRIAHIITAHHSVLAQLKPGDEFRFKKYTIEEAEDLLVAQENFLAQLKHAITFKWNEYFSAH